MACMKVLAIESSFAGYAQFASGFSFHVRQTDFCFSVTMFGRVLKNACYSSGCS